MNAIELRIGNLLFDQKNRLCIVDKLSNDNYRALSINEAITTLPHKPIPLTEEFKKEFGENELVLVDKLGFVIFKNSYAYQFVFEDFPYIHSIQNIFSALTNQELKINL